MSASEEPHTEGKATPEEKRAADMSVVLVTDCAETIRKTVRHLRQQTARERLEIVVAAPSQAVDVGDLGVEEFCRARVVEVRSIRRLSSARAEAVLHTSAPLVAFVESHSYPEPGWARALIDAHRQPWAAVGPVMANANPGSMISWANFLLDYGRWAEPAQAGVAEDLPGHNSSYKRPLLLEYGAKLEAMLGAETLMHWDLRARGYQLYLEPGAKTRHLNISVLSSWLPERFHSRRLFGAARSRRWPLLCRLLYAVRAPLARLGRLPRILGYARRCGRKCGLIPRVIPALLVGQLAAIAGEMAGYILGPGGAMEAVSDLELLKVLHLREEKRHDESS